FNSFVRYCTCDGLYPATCLIYFHEHFFLSPPHCTAVKGDRPYDLAFKNELDTGFNSCGGDDRHDPWQPSTFLKKNIGKATSLFCPMGTGICARSFPLPSSHRKTINQG